MGKMNKREWMLQFVLDNPFYTSNSGDTIGAVGALYDAIVAATPDPADEGWIEHRGEKPYPEGTVEITLRNGRTDTGDADDFIWTHDDMNSDIIAWRPARD